MSGLSDVPWVEVKAALDQVRSGKGRRFADERRTIEAAVWRLRNGARWRAAQLHIRWSRKGTWARPREWRAPATRYDKTADSFSGSLHLAAAMDWLANRA